MRNRVRVYFELDPDDWHGKLNEGLWAEHLEGFGRRPFFELLNSPFFVRGVSYLDIVRARPRSRGEGDGMTFAGVVARGGHSTYMLLVPPESTQFEPAWQVLRRLGCTYESTTVKVKPAPRKLYSVDVPPEADIVEVHDILQRGEIENIWRYQEGFVTHEIKARPQ